VPALDEGAGTTPPVLAMPQPEAFLQHLDRLPVALLAGPQAAQDLQAMGVRTLGGLRALPRAGLARRVGPALLQALDRARGERPDPRAWLVAPETFESSLELQARADNAEQLLQAADVLLARLLAWAGARQGRVPRFELILRHEPRHRADDDRVPPQTVFELALATPSSDAAHLQSLLRERLGRLALPAPALELRIRCARLVHEAPPPQDLFAVRADAHVGFAQLLERLQARLGPDGVCQLRDLDDHRPEQATRAEPASVSVAASARSTSASQPSSGDSRPPGGQSASKDARREAGRSMDGGPGAPSAALLTRPAWLLPEPRRLREQTSRPLLDGHPLQLLAGPERLESGWWDGALAVRDYFIAQAGDGALVWVYRSRLASSADETGWFLHGWFG
jgi:protein ImuB